MGRIDFKKRLLSPELMELSVRSAFMKWQRVCSSSCNRGMSVVFVGFEKFC